MEQGGKERAGDLTNALPSPDLEAAAAAHFSVSRRFNCRHHPFSLFAATAGNQSNHCEGGGEARERRREAVTAATVAGWKAIGKLDLSGAKRS